MMPSTSPFSERVHRLAQIEQRLAASAEAGREAFTAQLNAAAPAQNCPRHGEDARELQYDLSQLQLELIYLCPACQREKQATTWRHSQDRAGIPHGLRHALLTNFAVDRPNVIAPTDAYSTPTEFLLAAKAIDRQERRNLYLAGHTGIGKSHLAAALANHRLKRGHLVLWTPLSSLFDQLHASYRKSSVITKELLIYRHIKPSLLILDDMAIGRMPEDGEDLLFQILEGRDQAARQTICTTNQPQPDAEEWLGDRCSDRLRSGGLYYCYGYWQSMRGETSDSPAS